MAPWIVLSGRRRRLAAASLLLPLTSAAAGGEPAHPAPVGPFAARVIASQNVERDSLGLSRMVWDSGLAASADHYAGELARTGHWQHSDWSTRVGQGENLWMGTRGAFTLEHMVGEWLAERKIFRSGTFPNVSSTGAWSDVGHYTQIIWAETTKVGCALRSSAEFDYLVCRYTGPGNIMGQRVGPVTLAATR